MDQILKHSADLSAVRYHFCLKSWLLPVQMTQLSGQNGMQNLKRGRQVFATWSRELTMTSFFFSLCSIGPCTHCGSQMSMAGQPWIRSIDQEKRALCLLQLLDKIKDSVFVIPLAAGAESIYSVLFAC